MLLTILIATIDREIETAVGVLLPERRDVRYVVSWQQTEEGLVCPRVMEERADVEVSILKGRGLSRNRNNGLRIAEEGIALIADSDKKTEEGIALIADSDERLSEEGIERLMAYYEGHAEVDVALLKVLSMEGREFKLYPEEGCEYRGERKDYYPISHEISFRVKTVKEAGVWFDERFGLGSDVLASGEEDVFLHDALLAGLHIRWTPIEIGWTDAETTGERFLTDKRVQRSKGATVAYTQGTMRARLRALREAAYHTLHHGSNPLPLVREMFRGISYVNKTRKPLPAVGGGKEEWEACTIVVPFHGRVDLLRPMLESLEAVDYPRMEVILVDNNSSREAREACEAFAGRARFQVRIIEERRQGASIARNTGLRHCETPWVYFFDSDDELSGDFLTTLMPRMRGYDVAFVPVRQKTGSRLVVRDYKETSDVGYQILSGMWCTPSALWRTDYLRETGGWNEGLTYWDDWELGCRAMSRKPRVLWATERAFHVIHIHADSITGGDFGSREERLVEAMKAVAHLRGLSASALSALYLRTKIVEGMLRREGVSRNLWPRVCIAEVSAMLRFYGRGLQAYVAIGGRGGWKIGSKVISERAES